MPFVQDRFAIGLWVDPPRTDTHYKWLAEAGFNLVLAGFQKEPVAQLFALLKKYKLKGIPLATGRRSHEVPHRPEPLGLRAPGRTERHGVP